MMLRNAVCLSLTAALGLSFVAGCGNAPNSTGTSAGSESGVAASAAGHHHDHSGWWCTEHGVPEDKCGLCSPKLAAEFKRKGDWCSEHDRPDSQCFECHPEYEAQFIALYEAKFGEQPPARPKESGSEEK